MPPVAARRIPVVRTYGTVAVTDDYAWLEDDTSAETKAFVDAQNALSSGYLEHLPERAAVHARYTQIFGASSPDFTELRAVGGHLFALNDTPPKQQKVLVDLGAVGALFGKAGVPAEHVVLDPNAVDPSGETTIDLFAPSPDAKVVAVSLSKGGSESGDLHFVDVETGQDRGEILERAHGGTGGGAVAWNADGTGVYYTRYPRKGERPDGELDLWVQVWFHKLGTPPGSDTYAFGKDLPKIAEYDLVRSEDGKRILATVHDGDGGALEHHVLEGGTWTRISRFADGLGPATLAPDGKVYAVARGATSPRGKVVAFESPYRAAPRDVLPEGDGVVDQLVVRKDALYVVETVDGPSRLRRFPIGGDVEALAREPSKKPASKKVSPPEKPAVKVERGARGPALAVLPLPALAQVEAVTEVGEDLLVRVQTYVEPPRWLLYRATEHRLAPTSWAKLPAFAMTDAEVTRATCSSKDGTQVPMSIIAKRGAPRDRDRPTLLAGYGGFGISERPAMFPQARLLLDAGGVLAIANLRGGGERGEAWHKAGMLTRKQNVFDDFDACTTALFELGWTRPERLGIRGGSNGGLLLGAAMTQHPERYRVAIAQVGLYDMLRWEESPNGKFTVTEYGSVGDPAQLAALHAYSPYHRVRDDVAYPSVLFTTGANDPRVDPMHSRKMTARMQAATASSRPILLRAYASGGHGLALSLAAKVEEETDLMAFVLHELGARI